MTAKNVRTWLPQPNPPNDEGYGGELEAIDAIYAAYMALNAADSRGRRTMMASDSTPTSPMKLTSRAAISALMCIPGIESRDAKIIWDGMRTGGSDARYVYDLWRKGEI